MVYWKLDYQSWQKEKNQPIIRPVIKHYDWFILLVLSFGVISRIDILLLTQTISVMFTRSYHSVPGSDNDFDYDSIAQVKAVLNL